MSDPVSLARSAREDLARALQSLQAPGVPDQLLIVAESVAAAMSSLHQIEATGGAMVGDHAPLALDAIRRALALLQAQSVGHPAVNQATEAVAGSLGIVHSLVRSVSGAPPAPGAGSASAGSQVPRPAARASRNPPLGATQPAAASQAQRP